VVQPVILARHEYRFTGREAKATGVLGADLRVVSNSFCRIINGPVNSTKEIIGIKRLVKQSDSAFGEYALSDLLVAMAGNKDNGQFGVLGFDAKLQLRTVHSWHPHVGDEAACFGEDGGLQGFFGCGERHCAEVGRLQQALERFPNLGVVIHDKYDLFRSANQGKPSTALL
jgi:hypothetical protein